MKISNLQGLSFSDIMYVSKRSMANAVSNLSKHLETVSETLAVSHNFSLFTDLP